jgi:uncharacterized damage-inducible protein DinB
MNDALTSLLRYKAWAEAELFADLLAHRAAITPADFTAVLRILRHTLLVDRIFAAHLQGHPHGLESTWPEATPPLDRLVTDAQACGAWLIQYAASLESAAGASMVTFTFTDGKSGRMSRAEILAHLVTHSGYHRGEVRRMVPEIAAGGAADVFTGFLHRTQPDRRRYPTPSTTV